MTTLPITKHTIPTTMTEMIETHPSMTTLPITKHTIPTTMTEMIETHPSMTTLPITKHTIPTTMTEMIETHPSMTTLPITKHTIPTTMTEMTNIQTLIVNLLDIVNIQQMTKYMNAKKDHSKASLPVLLNFVSANDKIT